MERLSWIIKVAPVYSRKFLKAEAGGKRVDQGQEMEGEGERLGPSQLNLKMKQEGHEPGTQQPQKARSGPPLPASSKTGTLVLNFKKLNSAIDPREQKMDFPPEPSERNIAG